MPCVQHRAVGELQLLRAGVDAAVRRRRGHGQRGAGQLLRAQRLAGAPCGRLPVACGAVVGGAPQADV